VNAGIAMQMFDLEQHETIWDELTDTHCVIGWSSSRLVLAFRCGMQGAGVVGWRRAEARQRGLLRHTTPQLSLPLPFRAACQCYRCCGPLLPLQGHCLAAKCDDRHEGVAGGGAAVAAAPRPPRHRPRWLPQSLWVAATATAKT
jgi:hypothetical protein